VENAYPESFNSKFRDDCLNEHGLTDLDDAHQKIEAWRVDCNEFRPHNLLANATPKEYSSTLGFAAWVDQCWGAGHSGATEAALQGLSALKLAGSYRPVTDASACPNSRLKDLTTMKRDASWMALAGLLAVVAAGGCRLCPPKVPRPGVQCLPNASRLRRSDLQKRRTGK
jgi:hypothetical protein